MEKYSIKKLDTDFKFLESNLNTKGSRIKRLVIDNNNEKAFFKYEGNGYLVSEVVLKKCVMKLQKFSDMNAQE